MITVDELRALLAGLPGETPVLVSGYEGGLTSVAHAGTEVMQELDRGQDQDHFGRYVTPQEAAEEVRGGPGSEWRYMVGGKPPQLVGEPFQAVFLRREGR